MTLQQQINKGREEERLQELRELRDTYNPCTDPNDTLTCCKWHEIDEQMFLLEQTFLSPIDEALKQLKGKERV